MRYFVVMRLKGIDIAESALLETYRVMSYKFPATRLVLHFISF